MTFACTSLSSKHRKGWEFAGVLSAHTSTSVDAPFQSNSHLPSVRGFWSSRNLQGRAQHGSSSTVQSSTGCLCCHLGTYWLHRTGSNQQQPHSFKRSCSCCSGTSPGRALPAPGRGTGLQPLTSFQQDRAQTSVPSRDCARPPRRTDTLCNAETDFTEELGIAANQCSTPRIWPSVCRNNKGLAMKPAHVCSKSCLIICLLAKTF